MLTGLVFRYLAFFAGLLLFFSAQAMEAPRVDGIRWVNASQVEITWSVVDVGMISGYARSNSSERTCAAGIGVSAWFIGHGTVFSAAGGPQIYVDQGESLASVAERFIRFNGRGGKFLRNSDTRYYSSYCGSFVTASATVTDYSGMVAPWAPCVNIPVVPVSCSVSGAALNINHGTLAPAAVNGAKASVNFSLFCNRDVNISFALAGGINILKLSNNISTLLSLADGSLNKPRLVRANVTTPFTLISTLSSTTPSPGNFTGSTVVFINYL